MIELYKRFVIWNTKILTYIPGYRKLGRFMLKNYTKNFWRTWVITMITSLVVNTLIMRLMGFWTKKIELDLEPINHIDPNINLNDLLNQPV